MKREYIKPNVKKLLFGDLLVPVYEGSTIQQLARPSNPSDDEEIDEDFYDGEEERITLWE